MDNDTCTHGWCERLGHGDHDADIHESKAQTQRVHIGAVSLQITYTDGQREPLLFISASETTELTREDVNTLIDALAVQANAMRDVETTPALVR